MRSTLLLLFAALAFATASTVSESGKKALEDAWKAADKELRVKMNGTDSSVIVPPVKMLKMLESAGKKDQDAIAAYGDNDQVKAVLNCSVVFWKNKMSEVIRPYITNPKAYENLVIDFPFAPPDPKNTTKAYKEAEQNITAIVKNATAELQKMYDVTLKEIKAKSVREVTCSTFYCMQLMKVLKEMQEFVTNNGQWAKQDSDNGEIKLAITNLQNEIETGKKQFKVAVTNIGTQFKMCTKT